MKRNIPVQLGLIVLLAVVEATPATAQDSGNRLAAQSDYRFRTIDLQADRFGTPEQTDLQSFWSGGRPSIRRDLLGGPSLAGFCKGGAGFR